MFKNLTITTICLVSTIFAVQAQQYTAKNLLGRWQSTRSKNNNVVFLTDSTGAWLATDGFLYNTMNYTAKVNNDVIELKYTIEPNRKSPHYANPDIRFLNDSTFLIRFDGAVPKDADTTNKKVGVYTRIKKQLPGTQMRQHNYDDIIGGWNTRAKDSLQRQTVTFVNQNTAYYYSQEQGIHKMRYVIDFAKQPIPVDFYLGDKLLMQAFLGFYSKDTIRMEFFKKLNRGDHFTTFGNNRVLLRNKKQRTELYQ